MLREIDEEKGKEAGGESWPMVGEFVVVVLHFLFSGVDKLYYKVLNR
jgi:hypothetical protein